MAAKKKAAEEAVELVAAFARCDWETEGDVGPVFIREGQRLDLAPDEFAKREKAGDVEEAVFAKMLTGIEGGKYSLRPHDNVWLPRRVYEAWKNIGYCEPTADDPDTQTLIKAHEQTVHDAEVRCANLKAEGEELVLLLHAALAQVATIRGMIKPKVEGEELGEEARALLDEVIKLHDLLSPPQADEGDNGTVASAGEGDPEAPQLNLN